MQSSHSILLTEDEYGFINRCFAELLYGASAVAMKHVLGDETSQAEELKQLLSSRSASNFPALSKPSWRVIYNVIHAAIYALGDNELETLTGFELNQAINTNLKITSQLWGTYEGGNY